MQRSLHHVCAQCIQQDLKLSSLEDNLKMASKGRNMQLSNITIKCTLSDIVVFDYMYVCMYVCRFQNIVLRRPTPRLHRFLSSQWPSCRFLSFMAFLIPSIQFFFGLSRALLFCFGIHFNTILGNLHSAILQTWPYHVSWFCSFSLIIGSSNPICRCLTTYLFQFQGSSSILSHPSFNSVNRILQLRIEKKSILLIIQTGPHMTLLIGRVSVFRRICCLYLQASRPPSKTRILRQFLFSNPGKPHTQNHVTSQQS